MQIDVKGRHLDHIVKRRARRLQRGFDMLKRLGELRFGIVRNLIPLAHSDLAGTVETISILDCRSKMKIVVISLHSLWDDSIFGHTVSFLFVVQSRLRP